MDSTWQRAIDLLDKIETSGDDRVADWLLIRSPLPIVYIFITYLAFVVIGPRWMKDRKPFHLKSVLIIYNGFQVFLSSYMFYEFLVSSYSAGYSLTCQPVDFSMDPLSMRMANVSWWYFFSKIIDLIDTVFFILRKKNNQMTFLHVYHHSTMIFNWWLGAKYAPGGQSFFCALLNSFVHIVMYSYYLLSSMGTWIQPYLWWKRYLTQLQLVQFVLILIHSCVGLYNECDFPPILLYVVGAYCTSLTILFGNFYLKSYCTNRQQKRKPELNHHEKML